MLRPSPNHGTQRLPNDDDDDEEICESVTVLDKDTHVSAINVLTENKLPISMHILSK